MGDGKCCGCECGSKATRDEKKEKESDGCCKE